MQFDKEINGKYAEIFLKLREILLAFQDIKETIIVMICCLQISFILTLEDITTL